MQQRFRVLDLDYKTFVYYVVFVLLLYAIYKMNIFDVILDMSDYNIVPLWIVILVLFAIPIVFAWSYLTIEKDHLIIEKRGQKFFIQKSNIKNVRVYEKVAQNGGSSSYWISIHIINSLKRSSDYKLNFRRKHFKIIKNLVRTFNYPIKESGLDFLKGQIKK
ncbi:hypothetical protein C0581_02110 [Candidatus Parcubacteria bacterium]|nr:MAG: hypothetical protein C0581_02110 [Candidatus Parcubacteria bacterium]